MGYDAASRLVRISNPLGETYQLTYDAADNLLKQFDALGNLVMSVNYDSRNNPVRVSDALSNQTTLEHDLLPMIHDLLPMTHYPERAKSDGLIKPLLVVIPQRYRPGNG